MTGLIYSLRNNPNIIITAVDKGCSLILLNRLDYIKCMESYLNNVQLYKKLPKCVDNNKILKLVTDFTLKYSHCFDQKGKVEYLTNFELKTSNFYGLHKIHKSKILINQIKQSSSNYIKTNLPADLPFRGITAGVNSATSKLSEFLDILLKPICPKIPSHVRDYVDFLHKLPGTNHDNIDDIVIVSCDIVNMYPNITIDLGLKAIKYWLNKFPKLLNFRFTPEFVLEGLELVLMNSNFQFNGDYFALIKGTATGTTVAPHMLP